MTLPPSRLAELVSRLPEIYQPIYGHPELSGQPSRPSHDRWEEIRRLHGALAEKLGRPVRVLDLGCSQGFFSLALAEAGAIVHGVDYNEANIAVCQALAAEHLALRVSFAVGKVEEVLAQMQPGEFDLVLGLSVFHHLNQEHGHEAVTRLLAACAPKIVCGLFELALASEPVYWAPAQPSRPHAILEGFEFVHTLSLHGTHLSEVQRPLVVASSRIWYLDGELEPYDICRTVSHHLAADNFRGSRKYFLNGRRVAKVFSLETLPHLVEANRAELKAEAAFLMAHGSLIPSARLAGHGENSTEAWLVREQLAGTILSDLLAQQQPVDPDRIIRETLDQLCALEAAGLYHTDLRAWNILMAEDGGVQLIDYGSISNQKEDVVWPHDLFLAFWIFVREVATGQLESPIPLRQPFISPFNLPEPWQAWARRIWARPTGTWSFRLFRELLKAPEAHPVEALDPSAASLWMGAMERHLDLLGQALRTRPIASGTLSASPAEVEDARGTAAQLTAQGEAHEAGGSPGEALDCYLKAMETSPDHPLSFLRASALLEKSGDPAGARRCLEAALDHAPKDPLLWDALIRLGLDQGDPAGAGRDAWDALGQLPEGGGGRWHRVVAQALLAQGSTAEAQEVIGRGLRAHPGNQALEDLRQSLSGGS